MHDVEGVAVLLRRGTSRLGRRLRTNRPPGSLSSGKIGVLGHLHLHGPASPGEVAAAEGQQPQSLSRVFAELEAADLVRRSASGTDGRRSILTITPAGSAELLEDMRVRDAWLTMALATLNETEVGVLRLAAGLMERLGVEGRA
jgi:DNA-binding MarR family transcriptional regulator